MKKQEKLENQKIFREQKSSKGQNRMKGIMIFTKIGKILSIIWVVLGVSVVMYVMTHQQQEVIEGLPSYLFLGFVLMSVLVGVVYLISAVMECLLVVKANGLKALRPVIFSYFLFYLIIAAYNFITQAPGKNYLYALVGALAITIGSCTMNLWKRKGDKADTVEKNM